MGNPSMHVVVIPHGFQEHYALGFVNGLASNGVTVDFIRADNMDSTLLHRDISWFNLGRNTDSKIGAVKKLWRFLVYHIRLVNFVAARRGSVVHVIGLLRTPLVTGVIEGLLFRTFAARYVLTVHNLLPHDRHTVMNKWLFRWIYRIPHLLIVHTKRMKDELVTSFGIKPERIVIMQHGLNDIVPDNNETRTVSRAQLDLPSGVCMLLFFGRIAPYKGLETLLDAFAELDGNSILVIAGAPVSQGYRRRIEELIQLHPRRTDIICRFGFVPNTEVASYFRAADALMMPYRHIDQSGVLFLAFRFGLPVVAFDVGAMREYILHDVGVLVAGESAQDFARGIREFQQEAKSRFDNKVVSDVTRRFRWEVVVVPLIRAFSEGS